MRTRDVERAVKKASRLTVCVLQKVTAHGRTLRDATPEEMVAMQLEAAALSERLADHFASKGDADRAVRHLISAASHLCGTGSLDRMEKAQQLLDVAELKVPGSTADVAKWLRRRARELRNGAE